MNTNQNSSMEIKECDYKCEHYSAREDGMIMRHHRNGMNKRKLDDVWTFGNQNATNRYMYFGGERVHRIVATAFHGEAPSDQHVVDHIDTNRCNNRPENLRWLTKLENILNNEITRKKVEMICGSVKAFLENPQLLSGCETMDKNFSWMKNVTKEEAQNCLANWSHWAKTAKPDPNYKKTERIIDDWIYKKPMHVDDNIFVNKVPDEQGGDRKNDIHEPTPILHIEEEDNLYDSLTPSAKQEYWRTPAEFPCCPTKVTNDGLAVYMNNLKIGDEFSRNKYGSYYVVDKGMKMDEEKLVVLTTDHKDGFLSWGIVTVSIKQNKYVHKNVNAKLGKEYSEKLFKNMTGQGELTNEDIIAIDSLW